MPDISLIPIFMIMIYIVYLFLEYLSESQKIYDKDMTHVNILIYI